MERALRSKDKPRRDSGEDFHSFSERYTIFHALFEVLKEKDKKRKRKD